MKDDMIIDNFTIALQAAKASRIPNSKKEKERKKNGENNERTDHKQQRRGSGGNA